MWHPTRSYDTIGRLHRKAHQPKSDTCNSEVDALQVSSGLSNITLAAGPGLSKNGSAVQVQAHFA